MFRRHLLLAALLTLAVLVPATPGAAADTDYEQVVDLTFPFAAGTEIHWPDTYHASRGGGRHHQSTDLMAPYGTPVHAAVGGTVTRAGNNGWGYTVTIRGTDGRSYHYLHFGRDDRPRSEAIADGVVEGSTVDRGQLIGFVGCSGSAVCDPRPFVGDHLHFEIHDDAVIDPYDYHEHERINPWFSLQAAVERGDHPESVTPRGDVRTQEEDPTADWRFADVPPDGVHHDDIITLVEEGWSSGCDERLYCPQDEVTRGHMAQFLAAAMRGSDIEFAEPDTDHFDDDDGTEFEDDVNLLAEHGIAAGTGDRTFSPDREVNRSEMSTFLVATLEAIEGQLQAASEDPEDPSFEDVDPDSPFADSIAQIAAARVTTGCSTNRFCPEDTVVRAQMASFLVRGLLAG